MKSGQHLFWVFCVLAWMACSVPNSSESSSAVLAEVYSMYRFEVEEPARERGLEALDSAAFAQRLVSCARGEEVRVVRHDVRAFFEREDVRRACERYGRALEREAGRRSGCGA